jgi:hypothetical protein
MPLLTLLLLGELLLLLSLQLAKLLPKLLRHC